MSSKRMRVRLHTKSSLVVRGFRTTECGGMRSGIMYLSKEMVEKLGTEIGVWEKSYISRYGDGYYRSLDINDTRQWYSQIIDRRVPGVLLKNIYEGGLYEKDYI